MSKKVKFGLFGAGNIARLFCRTVRNVEDAEIVAVCALSCEQAASLAEEFHIPKVYRSNEKLAGDPDVEAMYVGNVNCVHYENAKLALENGKHVLCEKPFMLNAAQAEEIVGLARQKGRMLMEGMWSRFHPATERVSRLIAQGAIGEVTSVVSLSGVHTEPKSQYGRIYNPATGGGAMLDFGVYAVNTVIDVLGENFESVETASVVCDAGVDVNDSMLFRYPDGRQAIAMCSCSTSLFGGTFIYGTGGYIRRTGWNDVQLCKDGQTPVDFLDDFPAGTTGYEYELKHFINCIEEGRVESERMPHSSSLAIMKVVDKAFEKIARDPKFIPVK